MFLEKVTFITIFVLISVALLIQSSHARLVWALRVGVGGILLKRSHQCKCKQDLVHIFALTMMLQVYIFCNCCNQRTQLEERALLVSLENPSSLCLCKCCLTPAGV